MNLQHLMPQERLKAADVTPAYEDAGLFRDQICTVDLDLVPIFFQNRRKDLIVRGFVNGNLRVDVVFAGRRKQDAQAIMKTLKDIKVHALKKAQLCDKPAPDDTDIRLAASVDGCWRRHFEEDESGWEIRIYSLTAARWTLRPKGRAALTYGEPPIAN